jgi:hypothetical protein
LKLRFWLPHEDLHNPTRKRVDVAIDISSLTRRVMKKRNFKARKRVDVTIDISSLTRRVMKKAQLQSSRFG